MNISRNWRASAFVFIVAFIFYSLPLGLRPFHTKGEPREAIVVQAMFEQQNFILPLRNGVSIPSKPPLFHWMAAFASSLLGEVSEFSVRLPSALNAALALGIFFFVVAHISHRRRALLASVILATAFEWSRSAGHARVDMTFSLWFMIAMCALAALLHHPTGNQRSKLGLSLCALIAIALTILAKGPAGLLLLGGVIGLYVVALLLVPAGNAQTRAALLRSLPVPLLMSALAALLAAVWYVAAFQLHGQEFLDVQLLRENIARVVEMKNQHVGHEKPFYFAFVHLVTGFVPWSLLFPVLGAWLWNQRHDIGQRPESGLLLAVVCVSLFLVVICISVSKRVVYFLPCFPALAYLLASCIEDSWQSWGGERQGLNRAIRSSQILLVIATFVLTLSVFAFYGLQLGGGSILSQLSLDSRLEGHLRVVLRVAEKAPLFNALLALSSGLAVLASYSLFRRRAVETTYCLASLTTIIVIAVNFFVLPAIAVHDSPREFMAKVMQRIGERATVVEFDESSFATIFYYGGMLPTVSSREMLPTGEKVYLLVREELESEARQKFPDMREVLKSERGIGLYRQRLSLVKLEQSSARAKSLRTKLSSENSAE